MNHKHYLGNRVPRYHVEVFHHVAVRILASVESVVNVRHLEERRRGGRTSQIVDRRPEVGQVDGNSGYVR